MKASKILLASLAVACSLMLSACATTWKVSGKCKSGGECEITGEIGGTFEKNAGTIDVSQVAISVSATGAFPASGMVTVRAKNNAGGTVGTASFPWTRTGDTVRISNPAAANAWLATVSGASTAEFSLDPVQVQGQPGVNSLEVGLSYAGQLKALQTTMWTSPNSGCGIGTFCSVR